MLPAFLDLDGMTGEQFFDSRKHGARAGEVAESEIFRESLRD